MKRNLNQRTRKRSAPRAVEAQIVMIGLGGAIGTGLFMGSGIAIGSAGRQSILSYALAGVSPWSWSSAVRDGGGPSHGGLLRAPMLRLT